MAIAASAAATFAPVAAQAEVAANVSAVSNYMWRGMTQNANAAAVQGGVDYANENGVYAGTWGSTLGGNNGYEQDFYAGYTGEVSKVAYDVGYIYYAYPIQNNADFSEVYVSGGIAGFTAGVNYSVSEAAANAKTGDLYAFASYGADITENTNFSVTVGNQNYAESNQKSYSHAQVAFGAGDFTFAYDKNFDSAAGGINKDKPVLSIGYSKDFIF